MFANRKYRYGGKVTTHEHSLYFFAFTILKVYFLRLGSGWGVLAPTPPLATQVSKV